MNKALKDMLIGVILGDAHLGRTGLDKAFISFEQSKKKFTNFLSIPYKVRLMDKSLGPNNKKYKHFP